MIRLWRDANIDSEKDANDFPGPSFLSHYLDKPMGQGSRGVLTEVASLSVWLLRKAMSLANANESEMASASAALSLAYLNTYLACAIQERPKFERAERVSEHAFHLLQAWQGLAAKLEHEAFTQWISQYLIRLYRTGTVHNTELDYSRDPDGYAFYSMTQMSIRKLPCQVDISKVEFSSFASNC
jgi:hypothetical protein